MKIIDRDDIFFPKKLLCVKPIVKKIYVEGNEKILNDFGIAVVGSRNSSKEGEKLTNEFVEKLVEYNINIISGLAIGIDSRAHKSCLINGGKTIAVLGSGFNNIYPKRNKSLFEQIIQSGGAVITEYPPDTEADSRYFPARNRIVSGLSDGVLVIEGKHRSGTTITARNAIEQEKPVFCLPRSVYNSYGIGPNYLIKQGGILVTSYMDIIDYYRLKQIFLNPRRKDKLIYDNEILKLLSNEILNKEELALRTNKSIIEINQIITILELEGLISGEEGKGYKTI